MIHSNFMGTYDVTIELKDGQTKHYKMVKIDNEQFKLGNIRLTLLDGTSVLYPKSETKKVTYKP